MEQCPIIRTKKEIFTVSSFVTMAIFRLTVTFLILNKVSLSDSGTAIPNPKLPKTSLNRLSHFINGNVEEEEEEEPSYFLRGAQGLKVGVFAITHLGEGITILLFMFSCCTFPSSLFFQTISEQWKVFRPKHPSVWLTLTDLFRSRPCPTGPSG